MTEMVNIPEPPGLPFLGNVGAIDHDFPLGSLVALSEKYGEIFRLRFPGRDLVVVSTHNLVNETCNEKRFQKCLSPALREVRNGVHDGLFTAYNGEENWGIAHRILLPAFGPISIRGMFDEMHDIAAQLALKWARHGPDNHIVVTEDFTRLTLDTLALCSMGYRFNSYYSPTMHPFIAAMGDFLTASGDRGRRLPLPSFFYNAQDRKYEADIEVLRSTARSVLEARKGSSNNHKDLLEAMMRGRDPRTGRKMTDESIMDNLITFLIAGHETTSGLLSFAFYQLLEHPDAYQKAQQEVDNVVGRGAIAVEHLSKLPYLNGVLRETLRINSTIPLFAVEPLQDTLLAGKYPVKNDEIIVNLLAKSHLDPRVFGDDALDFRPERMMDEPFEKLNKEFPNCWKPFGNGVRGCIGRPFAWQEALLVMTVLLQNFNFVLDPGYVFGVKQTLTLKPKDLTMRAILRDSLTPIKLEKRLTGLVAADEVSNVKNGSASEGSGHPMTILYGSNTGTCEALARRIAKQAPIHGFRVSVIDCLDSAKDQLPSNQPVVIITSSYEGQPPDNAGHFVSWIQNSNPGSLAGVSYAVFGCGHKDWVQTFHRIPKLIDHQLEALGGTRLAEPGLVDVSAGEIFTQFESWEDSSLWPSLVAAYPASASYRGQDSNANVEVTILAPRASTLRQDVKEGIVVDRVTLTSGDEGGCVPKTHMEIKLPADMTYSAGDYLVVLPMNPHEIVQRAIRRFSLPRDAYVKIRAHGCPVSLPTDGPVSANDILSSYVELSQPATKRDISTLVGFSAKKDTKLELQSLANKDYDDEVKTKRLSIIDVLERFPDIDLPIGVFLTLIPPMRLRQYSISSSPLWNPRHATITFSVLNKPPLSGSGAHIGVATSYLDSLKVGDTLQVAIRPSRSGFKPPPDPKSTPVIYISAGSGIAPFRGFIQERAQMLSYGQRPLAPAFLFFGCRSPDHDDIYRSELDSWEDLGAVKVSRTYSRAPEKSGGCKHVDDEMWKQREQLMGLWKQGAKIYVCGSRGLAQSVREMVLKIGAEIRCRELDEESAETWFEGLRNTRYVTDIFD